MDIPSVSSYPQVITGHDGHNPRGWNSSFLDDVHFGKYHMQFAPSGRYLLFSTSAIDSTRDLVLLDFGGHVLHWWKHTNADDLLPKDICWLDELHFVVRMGMDVPHKAEISTEMIHAAPVVRDIIRVFDIRFLSRPMQQKALPHRIRHFDAMRYDESSWIVGTGFDLKSSTGMENSFNEGSLLPECYSSEAVLRKSSFGLVHAYLNCSPVQKLEVDRPLRI